jgi:16S rRNA processing protein RimM
MSGPDAAETVIVGRINGIWGVQGWVKVFSYTEPPDAIFNYQPWLIGPDGTKVSVESWKQQGPRLMAGLGIATTPEQAASLVDYDIAVPAHTLPRPAPGSYYWRDLVGLKVINLEGMITARSGG